MKFFNSCLLVIFIFTSFSFLFGQNNLKKLKNRADKAFTNKKYDDALKTYEEIIEKDSSYAYGYYALAIIKEAQGDPETALRYITKAISFDSVPDYISTKGVIFQNMHKWEEAMVHYNEAERLGSNNYILFLNRGQVLGAMGKYKSSIEDFDRVISRVNNKYKILALVARGNAKRKLKYFNEALEDFKLADNLGFPKDDFFFISRGELYLDMGKFDEAILDFSTLIKMKPHNGNGYNARGMAKSYSNDYKGAELDYNRAIELCPDSAGFYSNRALLFGFFLHQYEKALEDLNKAISLDSANFIFYCNRGLIKDMNGDPASAIPDFDRSLQLKDNEAYTYNNRGYAKSKIKDYEGAIEDINKSLELNPKNSYAYRNRAKVFIEMNLIPDACIDLTMAKELGFGVFYGNEVNELIKQYCE